MRHPLRNLLLVGLFALTTWVTAPALSSTPYLPRAVDFEQPLAGVERVEPPRAAPLRTSHESRVDRASHAAAHEPVSHRTAPQVAPKRFDLVGLAGEIRDYELRARDGGGRWSAWIEVGEGSPAYFGGAEEVQLRSRGWRPQGLLHYVNVSGTGSPASSLLTSVREAVNGAFMTATASFTSEAGAAVGKPELISRREWGAERGQGGCEPRKRPDMGKVKAAVVHHTVSANGYSESEAPGLVLGICRYHRNANGWDDIGYNAVVDRFGNVYEGREGGMGRPVVGAHSEGFNTLTTGVASLGTHSGSGVGRRAKRGISRWLAYKLDHHDVNPTDEVRLESAGGSTNRYEKGEKARAETITKHRRLSFTECPGGGLAGEIDAIQRMTKAIIRRSRG